MPPFLCKKNMQSSSNLFPVALTSAERRGDLSEDVYRLKPGNSPDPSVELAVTRLGMADEPQVRGVPVILLHGSFSNRRFWYSPKGIGLGAYLARAGFDVWIPEMRGHGLSRRNAGYRQNRVADYARYDLPAIAAFVREQSGQIPHWIGHSLGAPLWRRRWVDNTWGGGRGLRGVFRYPGQPNLLAFEDSSRGVGRTPTYQAFRPVVRFTAQAWSEDEPIGLALESMRWHGLFGRFGDADKDWWAGLTEVAVPALAVSAAGDHQDPTWACRKLFEQLASPHKQFVCLGREQGFSGNFGHVEMLVSKPAQAEVWPLVARWLKDQQSPLLACATEQLATV